MAAVEKRNFTRGIFSPELEVRKDVGIHSAGARQLKNVLLQKFGGLRKRQGTEFVYALPENNEARLFPFIYATSQSYIVLMGQASLRAIAASDGTAGVVVSDGFGITGITNASPGVVTAPFHGLVTGDQVYIDGESGMSEVNGRIYNATVIDSDQFSIGVDTSGYGVWTASDLDARVAPPVAAPVPPPIATPSPAPAPPPTVPGYDSPPFGGGVIP